jgi:carboxyl-terminal processing protease
MTLKNRVWVISPVVVLVCALLGGLYGPQVTAQTSSEEQKVQESLQSISKVLHAVEVNYADPVDVEKTIYNGAIPSMLRTLDPHSNFFDPKSFAQLREEQRGRYYGVGMTVTPREGKTIVLAPFPGSPAQKAGLRPGDIIVQVDGTMTEGKTTSEIADLLKGPRGTVVKVYVEREGHAEPIEFSIVRDEIPRFSVEHSFLIEPGVAYIRNTSFMETTSRELRDKLREFDPANLKGLVLDLRNNPGGLLNEGVNVSDMLLQRGQLIVSHRGKASPEKRYTATRGNRGYSFPLVVIINRFSASAAEIVTGAIQDHDRGLVVGEASFGKGLVQTVYPLSDQAGLALTTAKYYTPSGRLIQREYSGVSLYDYYYNKDKAEAPTTDMRTTDAGRTVYGGGGITPDVEIPERKLNPFQELMIRRFAFFNYAKHYLATHPSIPQDFEATDDIVNQFRQFLHEQQIAYSEEDFAANREFVQRRIKLELVLSVFGTGEAYKIEAADDPQIQKAVELLPQAASLLENARQVIAQQDNR